MKKMALLAVAVLLLAGASPVWALEERTLNDEPSVSKPQSPAKAQSPGPAAPKASQSAPSWSDTQPAAPAKDSSANSGVWTPGETRAPAAQDYGSASPETSTGNGGRIFDMPEAKKVETYSRKEVDEQVMGFFEGGARGFADLISRAFERYGEPVGFIKGGEGAGALVVGLRYGEGWLHLKNGQKAYVYWQSPSIGLDLGVNTSKVFCLVYKMTNIDQIYQRFPSVDGSAYVVGGFGMNYQNSGGIVLAPIRFGVGLRLGANLGYMHFTRERTINPF